jgi:hypothetical protein
VLKNRVEFQPSPELERDVDGSRGAYLGCGHPACVNGDQIVAWSRLGRVLERLSLVLSDLLDDLVDFRIGI